MKIPIALLLISLAAVLSASSLAPALGDPAGKSPQQVAEEVRAWRQANEQSIVDSFVQLLSIPNVAHDEANIQRNAAHITGLLRERGFSVDLLETGGAPPVVFAERKAPGAERTLMIYAHYDGQPVNADDWASDPWTPVLRDGPVRRKPAPRTCSRFCPNTATGWRPTCGSSATARCTRAAAGSWSTAYAVRPDSA